MLNYLLKCPQSTDGNKNDYISHPELSDVMGSVCEGRGNGSGLGPETREGKGDGVIDVGAVFLRK